MALIVNPKVAEPTPPGPWVDDERCECGELYDEYRTGVRFSAVAASMSDGSFKSRGPVLWRMRVAKLTEWYLRHRWCGRSESWMADLVHMADLAEFRE